MVTVQEIMQSHAVELYRQLRGDLRMFGMTELQKILILDVPNKSLPMYLNILTFLEWTEKHASVSEKQGEELCLDIDWGADSE